MAKRILYFSLSMYRGGAEKQIVDLILEAKRREHNVALAVLKDIEHFEDELISAGVDYVSLGLKKSPLDLMRLPFGTLKLLNFVRRFKPNVIHSHMGWANIFARVFFKVFSRAKMITTAHNTIEGGRVLDFFYKATDKLSNYNTIISQAALDRFISKGMFKHDNSELVYNGVFFPEEITSPLLSDLADGITWLAVGRLTAQKNYHLTLEAFSKYKKIVPNSRLIILGDGELKSELIEYSIELGLVDSVEFKGVVDNVDQYIRRSSAFIMTSSWEGLGIAIIEALRGKLPAVVTKVGGIPEICSDNSAFRLVRPDLDEVVDSMVSVSNDISSGDILGHVEQNYIEVKGKFSMDVIFDRWEQIYGV